MLKYDINKTIQKLQYQTLGVSLSVWTSYSTIKVALKLFKRIHGLAWVSAEKMQGGQCYPESEA